MVITSLAIACSQRAMLDAGLVPADESMLDAIGVDDDDGERLFAVSLPAVAAVEIVIPRFIGGVLGVLNQRPMIGMASSAVSPSSGK